MKHFFVIILVLGLVAGAQAKLVTQAVEYQQDGTVLQGYLAYDDAVQGKRPGVLVVHEWWGLNDYAKKRAEQLAQMGYVALAADMYGKGVVTKDVQEAAKLAGILKNPALLRTRALAGLQVLSQNHLVDQKRLAAIGFCFGGSTVLEMAYAGASLEGVVSFHGAFPRPSPEDAKNLKARILVLHGADDPLIPPEEITRFMDAMRQVGADWQMIYYGGAMHSFSNPEADKFGIKGAAYNPKVAARSWRDMQVFFEEIFSPPAQKNP